MADYGRYDEDTRTRSRGGERYGREENRGGRGRERGMFDYGSARERSRFGSDDRDDERGYGEDRSRGFFGSGRGDWSERDRERGDRDRNRDRDYDRDRNRGEGDREDRHYGSDDYNRGLAMDETSNLIASNKVEGTAVYGRDGDRLGSIYNFMVDKFSGKVRYAVMRYSTGFLGFGERYYPLPWKVLSYDERVGGYRIDMAERDLEDAPSFDRDSEPRFSDDYNDRVHGWYGMSRREGRNGRGRRERR